jgi:Zn-dependent protease with chaperone function
MELRHPRSFVAIAEERSFTRASKHLWVAWPGLSTVLGSGSADQISLAFLGVLLGDYLVWLLYGISAGDDALIITDALGLAASIITLSISARLRRRQTRSLVARRPSEAQSDRDPTARE